MVRGGSSVGRVLVSREEPRLLLGVNILLKDLDALLWSRGLALNGHEEVVGGRRGKGGGGGGELVILDVEGLEVALELNGPGSGGVDGHSGGLGGGEASGASSILGRPLDKENLGKDGMRRSNEPGDGKIQSSQHDN